MSHHQNAQQIQISLIANTAFENVAKFKHFRIIATNQNCVHRTLEQIQFGECLLPYCSESFVFLSQNLKDENIQHSNFTHCFVWA
jgi:hypothetical protein